MAGNPQMHAYPPQGQQPPPPPKPPRKNPYHDGISQSAQQYDLYEMIRRPNAHHTMRPPDAPAYIDPKEKARALKIKLEQEVEEKFEHQYLRRETKGLTLGKAIKAIFLLLVLPFYLILFQIPKWIFCVVIPNLYKRLETVVLSILQKIKGKILKKIERIKDKISSIKKNLINLGREKKTKEEKAIKQQPEHLDFFSFIFQGIWFLYSVTLMPIFKTIVWLFHAYKKIVAALKAMPTKVESTVQSIQHRMQQMAVEYKAKSLQIGHQALDYVKNGFKEKIERPVALWCKPKFKAVQKKVSTYIKSKSDKIVARAENIKNLVLHPWQTFKKFCFSIKERINQKITHIKTTIESWIQSKKEFLLHKLQNFKKAIDEKIFGYVEKKKNRLIEVFLRVYNPLQVKFQKISNTIAKIKETCRKQKEGIISKIKTSKPYLTILQLAATLKKWHQELSKRGELWASKARAFSERMLNRGKLPFNVVQQIALRCQKKLEAKMQKISEPIQKTYSTIKQRMFQWRLRYQLLCAWNVVLMRYGMRLVRETAESIRLFR